MSRKPTYEELEQRVRELEKEAVGFKGVGEGLKKVASATAVDIDRKRGEEALKQSE